MNFINPKKLIVLFVITLAVSLSSCSSDKNDAEPNEPVITDQFKEGVIEMGMFSGDIDFGTFIDQLDFSRADIKDQFTNLTNSLPSSKNPLTLIQNLQASNPIAALGATLSISKCTYVIKDQVVLGKATGFGWQMDHYHNRKSDAANMYLETLVQTDQIAEQDKKLYASYVPSQDLSAGNRSEMELSNYERKIQKEKVNVSGYECDVIVYEMKNQDGDESGIQNPLNKLVVYTSSLFDKTINFTHPYYLPEDGGILRLDIYLEEKNTPTITMKPTSINARAVANSELVARTASPEYSTTDVSFGFRSLAIILSGWGVLAD
jgi:hypothetical protein